MHKFLRNNDESALQKLLSPSSIRPGVKTVLTSEEEDVIAETPNFPSKKGGLPLDLLTLLQLPLIEVGNAVRAGCYSIASYP